MNLDYEIEKIIRGNGASFYDSEIVTEFGETIFRVYITKEGGVTLNLCATISHELSPFLDVHPPMSAHYRLEVSSMGIERNLKRPSHFQNAIGEKLKIKVVNSDKLKGILKSADNKGIILETKHGKESYNYNEIVKAKTYFEWNTPKK
ncbi:MAG: ribosome maturation factor RimP [Sulfurovum sp.]|nr:ribosome maturation factor RimP [Sulfurovaceae bacterium]